MLIHELRTQLTLPHQIFLMLYKSAAHLFLEQTTSLYWTELRGLSPHANYTDRAAAAGRRS